MTRRPALRDVRLSPDGQRIAILRQPGESDRKAFVDLVRIDALDRPPARIAINDLDVVGLTWANDRRLLIQIQNGLSATFTVGGQVITVNSITRRLLSIAADGTGKLILFGNDAALGRANRDLSDIVGHAPDDPNAILVKAFDPKKKIASIYRVDVVSGEFRIVEAGTAQTLAWQTQDGVPVIRLDAEGSALSILARTPGETEWRKVRKVRAPSELIRPDFRIVGATEEPGVFLASVSDVEAPAQSLRRFDLRTGELGAVVATRPDRDVEGAVVDRDRRMVAAQYHVDRVDYDFADPDLARHFKGIQQFLGDASARIVDLDSSRNRFVIAAEGPRIPTTYFFYDRKTRHLEALGPAYPWLAETTLAKVEMLDVKTRDGATIRAYLTIPAASGRRPLVVLPHGGPELRDVYDFDTLAQALAAKGWFVLQPNFRGSGGYGRAHADAGHRHWGDRMQEDIDDSVAQVLIRGDVDPARVAICGTSYGGYAALMGVVRRPAFYRCAVSIAGVSDLPDMLAFERRRGKESYDYFVRLIGDPKADLAMLKAASPKNRAAEMRAPVLLIHGLSDTTVPPSQSKAMAAALRKAGCAVQHSEQSGVAHGGWSVETTRKIFAQAIAFIETSIA